MSIDPLAPQAATWRNGISLSPQTPRVRRAIADVFRRAAETAPNEDERLKAIALADKWEHEVTP